MFLRTAAVTSLVLLAGGQSAARLPPQTTIRAELQLRIGTRKSKVGERVVAKVTKDVKAAGSGAVLLPKNCLLIGRVTEVSPADKQSPARLGVLFYQATDHHGTQLLGPFRASIDRVFQDSNNGGYSQFSIPAEMGGGDTVLGPPVSLADTSKYAGMDHSTSGIPITYRAMTVYGGKGVDIGGLITGVGGNFFLDDGTKIELMVWQ